MITDPAYQFGYVIGTIIGIGSISAIVIGIGFGIYKLIKKGKSKLQPKFK